MKLDPPDSHHLSAATGWLELGNVSEAAAELEKIQSQLQRHPDVLAIRWAVFYRGQQYDACLETALVFVKVDPENVQSWVDLSIALYKTGNTQQAYDILHAKLESFGNEWVVSYNLACYAAQLGSFEKAQAFLARSMALGDQEQIKQTALEDPDLNPLWKWIQ